MSYTIYKYLLLPEGISNGAHGPKIPRGARLLSVGTQRSMKVGEGLSGRTLSEAIYVWAIVNPEAELRERIVLPFGTGHPLPSDMTVAKFVGAVQLQGLVFHVFDFGEADQ